MLRDSQDGATRTQQRRGPAAGLQRSRNAAPESEETLLRVAHVLTLLLASVTAQMAYASSLTKKDAAAAVQSAGYTHISKTDAAPGVWDVWASKDGIAYKVQVDAIDGTLIAAIPVEDDD